MLTLLAPKFPQRTGDAAKDYDALVAALGEWFRTLNDPNVLSLSQLSFGDAKAWTPVVTFATPGDLSVSYSIQRGWRVKVGQFVVADFDIGTSAFTHTTAAGTLQITGLPDAASSADANYLAVGTLQWGGITKATYTHCASVLASGSTTILVNAYGSGVAPASVTAADVPTAGTVRLRGQLIYRT